MLMLAVADVDSRVTVRRVFTSFFPFWSTLAHAHCYRDMMWTCLVALLLFCVVSSVVAAEREGRLERETLAAAPELAPTFAPSSNFCARAISPYLSTPSLNARVSRPRMPPNRKSW